MIILAYTLSGLSFLMSALFFIKLKSPLGWLVFFPNLFAGALSLIWAILGILGAAIGWAYQAFWAVPAGIVGAAVMIYYIWLVTRDHNSFANAFGTDWSELIKPEQASQMVQKRWTGLIRTKSSPKPSFDRDITFWITPDRERELLCDIWRPAQDNVSGLAFIYLHGSGWAGLDKDFGTRPFFRHLAVQGHTVMDVAYRLIPEVDIYGIIGDVKRAIAWMKNNSKCYGVNPEKIVLAGGSAGAHLALLAGYAPHHPELTPEDLKGADLSVCGIISYYGPADLLVAYDSFSVGRYADKPPVPIGKKTGYNGSMFDTAGRTDILLGGHPQDIPNIYQLASPITHVHPGCPPTLLIQGEKDFLVPVDATREFYTRLTEAGVPAINVILPRTEHAFDVVFPQINPAAQSALYDVDRFLALLINKDCGTVPVINPANTKP